jgi:hypothetical protein
MLTGGGEGGVDEIDGEVTGVIIVPEGVMFAWAGVAGVVVPGVIPVADGPPPWPGPDEAFPGGVKDGVATAPVVIGTCVDIVVPAVARSFSDTAGVFPAGEVHPAHAKKRSSITKRTRYFIARRPRYSSVKSFWMNPLTTIIGHSRVFLSAVTNAHDIS